MLKPIRHTAIAAAVLVAAASTTALADSGGSVQKAVDYRIAYMTILGWNAKPMGQMLKGEKPFEEEAFMGHAGDLAAAGGLALLPAFPEGSVTEDSAALEEIWFDWDDFAQKFADFQEASAALGEAVAGGDVEATKAAFGKVGDSCKACHKTYKE